MPEPNLTKFETICRRIRLNIPSEKRWSWDEKFGHALVIFEKEDRELVLLPIALEFEQKWDMDTIDRSSPQISAFVQSAFGLMPGQDIFVAQDSAHTELVLYATCWPWGDGDNFSLRVGLFSPPSSDVAPGQIRRLLSQWLPLQA
jgi:hypothetical protein